jgi:hypothetical protein
MRVVHRTHTQNLLWDSAVGHDLAFQRARVGRRCAGRGSYLRGIVAKSAHQSPAARKSCRGREVIRSAANGQFVARLAGETNTARFMILALGKKVSVEILQAAANKLPIVLQVGMYT